MWLITETDLAVLVCDSATKRIGGREIWIPRTLIERLTKKPAAHACALRPVEFTLPEWKINQDNLWDFVIG